MNSGDGFITLADGSLRWGRFGAAGVLARYLEGDGATSYFLARRSEWCHQGGCWGIPGGALHQDEPPVAGALREFVEEVGDILGEHTVVDVHRDDHGGWSYWTVTVDVARPFAVPAVLNWETAEARWIRHDRLGTLELHTAFRRTLGRLGYLPGDF